MSEAQKGIEIHEAHFPGRAPIDAYGNGGFRFAKMSHQGNLMCAPSGIYAWNVASRTKFSKEDFARILSEAQDVEVLLIGTGLELMPLPERMRDIFRSHNISADTMATGAAVRTYNVLISEGRAVAAAFLAVDV